MINTYKIKQYPIKDYLAEMNIFPVLENEYNLKYFSPFRDEKTPSFNVDVSINEWKDFGTDIMRSDIIQLVQMLEKKNFVQACQRITQLMNCEASKQTIERIVNKPIIQQQKKEIVLGVTTDYNSSLTAYLETRCISLATARKFIHQITYLNRYDVKYKALGMRNISQGWEIRSEKFKGCIGEKTYSIFATNEAEYLYIFEGMFDFLSFLEIKNNPNLSDYNADFLILHSLSSIPHFKHFLSYKYINLFFDNDESGKKAANKLMNQYPTVCFLDFSLYYQTSKDLNEHLCQKMKK